MSDLPKLQIEREPNARKDHQCCECSGTISTGDKYHHFCGVWDDWQSYRTCKECHALRLEISYRRHRDEWPRFGELYVDLFECEYADLIVRFMEIRRMRNAPESPNRWMEIREQEITNQPTGPK